MIERIIEQQRALSLAQIDFPDLLLPDFELLKQLTIVKLIEISTKILNY